MITGRGYEIGTKVQAKTGVVRIKVGKDHWMPEARYQYIMHKGPLEEGARVFHSNGDLEDNRPQNLSRIIFRKKRFVILKTSRVLYIPKTTKESETIYKKFEPLKLAAA